MELFKYSLIVGHMVGKLLMQIVSASNFPPAVGFTRVFFNSASMLNSYIQTIPFLTF